MEIIVNNPVEKKLPNNVLELCNKLEAILNEKYNSYANGLCVNGGCVILPGTTIEIIIELDETDNYSDYLMQITNTINNFEGLEITDIQDNDEDCIMYGRIRQ